MSVQKLQEIISPKFTEQIVLDIVKKKSGLSDICIKKIDFGDATKKGDSYLSDICRFKIEACGRNGEGQEEAVSVPLIVKSLPKNLGRRKTYRSVDFFEDEITFFDKVWTAFQKFQEESRIQEKFDSIPLVLSTYLDGSDDFVALYDLSYDGFTTTERGTGLDYDHTVAFLQALARFHALSLAFKEKNPDEFEKAATSLKETYFSERLRPWYHRFQQKVFAVTRDAVEKELPPEYLHKLDKLLETDLYGLLIRSCVVRGPLSVVTHGDVWVPNFLIKYEGTKPGKIVIIDFQLARYTTLVTDLCFFLFSCASSELVEHKWDDLVAQYHKALVESMQKYGAKNLVTLDSIHEEIKKHSVMGVGMSMEALIMGQLDDDEVSDLDAIKGDQAVPLESVWIIHPFKDQEKRKRIALMIKIAADKGFI